MASMGAIDSPVLIPSADNTFGNPSEQTSHHFWLVCSLLLYEYPLCHCSEFHYIFASSFAVANACSKDMSMPPAEAAQYTRYTFLPRNIALNPGDGGQP